MQCFVKILVALSLLVSYVTVHAADKAKTTDKKELTFYGFYEAYLSESAQEGLQTLLDGKAFRSAVPLSITQQIENIQNTISNPALVDTSTTSGQFKAFGYVPSPPERKDVSKGFPLALSLLQRKNPDDLYNYTFMTHNCFQCHAGVVDGKVVAGLGNAHVDQTSIRYFGEMVSQFAELPWPMRTIETKFEEEILKEFSLEIKNKITPTFQFAQARGENYGPYAVWKLLSRLINPATSGLEPYPFGEASPYDLLFLDGDKPKELPPVDPPPWWGTQYKDSNYWYNDKVAYERKAAHFSINFTSIHSGVNANHKQHVQDVARILDFVYETTSPPYPKSLDAEKVKQGYEIFHGKQITESGKEMHCSGCHGNYTPKPHKTDFSQPGGWQVEYPEKFKDVKTDPAYNEILRWFEPLTFRIAKLDEYFEDDNLVPTATVPTKPGYLAPPLVGIWASAPYFHNGSVPTVEAVLNSEIRPTIWRKNNTDMHAYNHESLGLSYQEVSESAHWQAGLGIKYLPTMSHRSVDYRAVYNTKLYGRGNMGHTFGDPMTKTERMAVIEFLKSLSGPDM